MKDEPIAETAQVEAHQPSSDDLAFVSKFESLGIAPEDFDHRSHVRLAYIYLCRHGDRKTIEMIRETICRVLIHIGVEPASKYHETMTHAWVLAVRHFMVRTPGAGSASAFIDANPQLLDTGLIMSHYSKGLLFSQQARATFVGPDLAPFPED